MPLFRPAGDSGIYVFFDQEISPEVSRQVLAFAAAVDEAALPGVIEVVPAYASALVYFDPAVVGREELVGALGGIAGKGSAVASLPPARHVEIPVCYGAELGPDLPEVARYAGVSENEVIDLHSARQYLVYCLGFAPGFAFMGTVDERIAIGRLPTPRAAVPAGSVGIAGWQTGAYPVTTTGGWRIIGRTPIGLFSDRGDAGESQVLLRPGDQVSFLPVSEAEFERLRGAGAEAARVMTQPTQPAGDIEVVSAGALTTVQDEGRTGWQRYGFAPNGPCDAGSFRLANSLVGNPPGKPGAAALECTMKGPTLRFHSRAVVAVTGADMSPRLNGEPFPMWQARVVAPGDVLALGPVAPARGGLRAYIAVRGGIGVPSVLGSRATDLVAGFGGLEGRALRRGDLLPMLPTSPVGKMATAEPANGAVLGPAGAGVTNDPLVLRLLNGPDSSLFAEGDLEEFLEATFRVSRILNRSGVRLEAGPRPSTVELSATRPAHVISKPMPLGSVQLPPDGKPIVLLAARPTLGGYPVIGFVPETDVNRLAQAGPGTLVRFALSERQNAFSGAIHELLAAFGRWPDLAELSLSDDRTGTRIRLVR